MAGGTLRIEEIKEKRGLIAMSGGLEQQKPGRFVPVPSANGDICEKLFG